MEILESVDTVLSAPPLPSHILTRCKIFLFTTSAQPPTSSTKRLKASSTSGTAKPVDRVVGCVVVQPIRSGMRVLKGDEAIRTAEGKRKREELVIIGDDAESGADDSGSSGLSSKAVICSYVSRLDFLALYLPRPHSPTRLPCKIGIHRIFTVPKYRGLGISKILLDVACEKTIYGYTVSSRCAFLTSGAHPRLRSAIRRKGTSRFPSRRVRERR